MLDTEGLRGADFPAALLPRGGLFARARADDSGEVLGRVRNFLDTVGSARLGFAAAAMQVITGDALDSRGVELDDAGTLAALRRAWAARDSGAAALALPSARSSRGPGRRQVHSRAAGVPAGRGHRRVLEIAPFLPSRKFAAAPGFRYLDIGAAEGKITAAVAETLGLPRGRATAVDVLPQADSPAFEFVQVGGEALPFPSESFGLVTMFMSAHHFRDAARVFAEAFRVARPGARLIVREHGRGDPLSATYYDVVHAVYETVFGAESTPEEFAARYAAGPYASYRPVEAWTGIAEAAGFVLVGTQAGDPGNFDPVVIAFDRP